MKNKHIIIYINIKNHKNSCLTKTTIPYFKRIVQQSCLKFGKFYSLGGIIVVFEKIKDILAEQFDVDDVSTLTESTNIADDLGADSLDVVEVLMSIEDEFKVEIPDEEIENIRTIGELTAFIESHQ